MTTFTYESSNEALNGLTLNKDDLIETWHSFIHPEYSSKSAQDLIELHNEYCADYRLDDKRVANINDLDNMTEYYEGQSILTTLRMLQGINPNNPYFNIETLMSFEHPLSDNSPVNLNDLLDYLIDEDKLDVLETTFGMNLAFESEKLKNNGSNRKNKP